jgi:hypothetical protein
MLVAHTCKPSYSGGRDQEDPCSKPALDKWFPRPYVELKKNHKKRAGGVAQTIRMTA